jgi:transcriptional regulator with XRE-family HTH domain
MGTPRQKVGRLPNKLLQIRVTLGLSQSEMHRKLAVRDIVYNRISDYERGKREPPLKVLLRYARVSGVSMEALADDDMDLPKKFR